MSNELRLNLAKEISAFAELTPTVAAFLEVNQISAEASYAVNLALEEMVLNLIDHSADGTSVIVTLSRNSDSITLIIEDDGQPFHPRQADEPDLDAPLEQRHPGGMGIHLVKTMFDRIDYTSNNGLNRLELELKLPGESAA